MRRNRSVLGCLWSNENKFTYIGISLSWNLALLLAFAQIYIFKFVSMSIIALLAHPSLAPTKKQCKNSAITRRAHNDIMLTFSGDISVRFYICLDKMLYIQRTFTMFSHCILLQRTYALALFYQNYMYMYITKVCFCHTCYGLL